MNTQIIENIKKHGNLPDLLKELRIEKGYSIDKISKILNISQSSIINYEKGNSFPNETNLSKPLEFYNIEPTTLMSDTYAKTAQIKGLLNEEYYTILQRIDTLKEQLTLYQELASDIEKVITPQKMLEEDLPNNLLTFNDENYQYSGLGDTFFEDKLFLEAGRYRLKGYFKPAKNKVYNRISIRFINLDEKFRDETVRHSSPYQPFSRILNLSKTGHYNINVDCEDSKKWAFSIVPV